MLVWAAAQTPELRGNLVEVRIIGVSDPGLERLVRVNLTSRNGTPVNRVDLEAERNRVLAMGTFAEVSLNLEDRGSGPILIVRVQENPRIAEITIEGSSFPEDRLLEILDERNLLRAGAIFNSLRAQEAQATLQLIYRDNNFPFDVPVTLDAAPVEDPDLAQGEQTPLRLTYIVSESVPMTELTFEGSSVLSEEQLTEILQPLEAASTFSIETYTNAVNAIAEAYSEQGFRGSGVDRDRTELVNETLNLRFKELKIVSIDTTAIGVEPADLSLKVGDLYNYDVLLNDVRRLAKGRSSDIRLEPLITRSGDVRVSFRVGAPDSAGPVDEILIEGNTVIATEELMALISLNVGDTFTSELAREDFRKIQALYDEKGYVIVSQPDFNYLDGQYVQRITELKIAAYEVVFQDEKSRTDKTVITRYLPKVGSVFNFNAVRRGLISVARQGAVQPLNILSVPTETPDEIIVRIPVQENQTRTFTPALQYATGTGPNSGFTASASYSDTNFLGRAHNFSVALDGQSTDLGLQFGGRVSYSIPWLFIDALDFQEVQTSVSASLFSEVSNNQPLNSGGNSKVLFPGAEDIPENYVFVGEYSQRDSGLRFSIGRAIYDNTTLRFSARGSYSDYVLEPGKACSLDADGNVEDNSCALAAADALEFMPQSGLSSFINADIIYDDRDSPEFPRSGVRAEASVGVGFGTDFRDAVTQEQKPYVYERLEFGVRTYALLKDIAPEEIQDPNHVFAFKLSAGQQFGGDYPTNKYFLVGNTPGNEATLIRGYRREDFNASQTYVIGSLEYRYDFGFSTAATQTIIGIAFVDVGWASGVPGFDNYATPVFAGAGLGVQVNLGFGGVALPAIRFDYGFSERNPSGVFLFRVGPVF